MTPTTLLILIASIILGITLFLWGRRGKRLNKNPTCRDCRFDLTGVYPESITCPECGGGLNRRRAIRMGARRRRWIPICLAVPLMLLPGATLALATFAALTGQDVNDYKPVALLIWEGEHAGEELVQAAGEQLLERYESGNLSGDEIGLICHAALEIQGNHARTWHESWGDILEKAHADSDITGEQREQYLRQGVTLDIELRPINERRSLIPARVRLEDIRIGSSENYLLRVGVRRAIVNGQFIPSIVFRSTTSNSSSAELATLWIGNQPPTVIRSFLNLSGSEAVTFLQGVVPEDPGPVDMQLTLTLEFVRGAAVARGKTRGGEGVTVVRSLSTEATEDLASVVQLIEPDPQVRAAFRAKLAPRQIRIAGDIQSALMANPGWNLISLEVDMTDLPMDAAFVVYARQGENQWRLGAVINKPTASMRPIPSQNTWSGAQWASLSVAASLGDHPMDIIFRPSPALARLTVDQLSIYGEEIVFEDVEVDWTDR